MTVSSKPSVMKDIAEEFRALPVSFGIFMTLFTGACVDYCYHNNKGLKTGDGVIHRPASDDRQGSFPNLIREIFAGCNSVDEVVGRIDKLGENGV